MEQHRIEVLLEAKQPIKHLAESFGNSAIMNTRLLRQPRGGFARVPEVSGDAMRHGLREAISAATLYATHPDGKIELTEAALRLLFAGGMVTGNGDSKSVRLSEYKKLVEMLPHLALLGGCAQNRTIPGRVDVEPATLVCAESAHTLPPWMVAECEAMGDPHLESFRQYVEEPQRVRMDPGLNPLKRALLDPGEADRIDRQLEASERASRDGDDGAKLAAKSTMMPRRFERLCQGSLFAWGLDVTLMTALDEDTFYTMFCAFAGSMVVGGGRATGHGGMRVLKLSRIIKRGPAELPAPEEVGLAALNTGIGRVFSDHLAARAPQVREFLKVVDA